MNTFLGSPPAPVSPMMIADRLLTLAQEADRAGYTGAASDLVSLMMTVLDEPPPARPI